LYHQGKTGAVMGENVQNGFSVLLSLYHKEKSEFLNSCLNSIQNQSLQPTEVVMVIDGPITLELEETLAKWEFLLPLNIVRLDKNVGLGAALNEGLKHCGHELVCRMDTDDICVPERFRLQITEFEKRPQLALLGGHIEEYENDLNCMISKRIVPVGEELILKECVKRNPFNHATVAFKKRVVLQAGGYKHHLWMEDYNLWLRVLSLGVQADNLDCVLVKARAGQDLISRRRGGAYIHSEWELYKLKTKLKLQNKIYGLLLLILRSMPRLLPASMLKFVYKVTRNS
jgi:glycosyltransferase involved in cell wall biosynthesis